MEQKSTFYLDSNIFVYASVNNEQLGQKARRLLQAMRTGTLQGITSCLTFDEVIWVLKKMMPEQLAAAGEQILDLHVKFLSVDKPLLHSMLFLIEEYALQPRDALHLATMQSQKVSIIISEDKDFDKIPGIERRSLLSLAI